MKTKPQMNTLEPVVPKDGDLILDEKGNVVGIWRVEEMPREEVKRRYPESEQKGHDED